MITSMDQVDLFSELMLTDEERVVDPQLGYPHGYAKLCCQAASMVQLHGLVTPFTEGPPRRFLPYSPQSGDFATLKEWDGLFPTVADIDRDPQNARKYAEELWQQLDHLGNAGFDPAKFRIDPYGNVVYWNADPSSPLAWEIDHWFPHSRGGKTVMTNLRVVQWQASQRKKNRLEFLVPWWDLQHGCSINQFLSAFASKNADFRKRSFALFFSGGEDASVAREHVGECRPWPQQFREKKAQCGLAAAAIVMVHKVNDEAHRPPLKPLVVCDTPPVSGMQLRRVRWSADEEEALQRGVNKFGSGSWKEIKENEPALVNRSTVQLKEKYRLMRVDWQNSGKENKVLTSTVNCKSDHLDRHSSVSTTLQKELRVKIMRDEEKREKETEIAELEETVLNLKQQNEKERLLAVELEAVLSKHKRRVEKQRRWAETQSSYRLCLERMIRDTMHQSISYKEQARLNQAACNALKARLDCQKVACEAAEKDLLQNYSQRGILEASVLGDQSGPSSKNVNNSANVTVQTIQGRDIVDVSSCVQDSFYSGTNCAPESGNGEVDKKVLLHDINPIDSTDTSEDDETADEVYLRRTEHRRTKASLHHQQEEECARTSADHADVGSPGVKAPTRVTELQVGIIEPVISDHVQLCPEPEAGDLNKLSSDLKQVQKDVIVVQSETSKADDMTPGSDMIEKGVVYKEEYLDELLQHVRFQLEPPLDTAEAQASVEDSPVRKSEEHLDELLHQVLATHLERMRKNDSDGRQEASDIDDEKLRQIGKQNLDKWLQVLLFDVESAGSSPPCQDSPLHRAFSPTFSQMTIAAAMRGKLNLQDNQADQEFTKKTGESVERPKGLWGVLLRKLSARQQSEQSLSNKLDAESDNEQVVQTKTQGNDSNIITSFGTDVEYHNTSNLSLEAQRCDDDTNTPTRILSDITESPAVPSTELSDGSALDQHFIIERRHFPRAALSDVDEISETDSLNSNNTSDSRQHLENKDPNKSGLRASIKAAGFVWKKAVKKLETRLQDGPHPMSE